MFFLIVMFFSDYLLLSFSYITTDYFFFPLCSDIIGVKILVVGGVCSDLSPLSSLWSLYFNMKHEKLVYYLFMFDVTFW